MKIRGVHHVQIAIPAGGEDAGRAFYGGPLGLAEVAKPEPLAGRGGCWFRGSNIEIHLGVDPEFRPARKAHLAIVVDDLEGAKLLLAEHGVGITEDDLEIGFRRFYVDDPFGNRLEFVAAEGSSEG